MTVCTNTKGRCKRDVYNIPGVAVSLSVVVVVTITSRAGILSGTFSTRHSSTVPSLSRTT